MEKKLQEFREKIKEKKMIEGALEVLQWDLETTTPKKGKDYIAEIVGYLSMKEYNLTTSQEFEDCVEYLGNNIEKLNEVERKEIEELKEDIEKMKKIPPQEYQEYSELVARTQGVWEEAKAENNYNKYKGNLAKIFEYTIKFANYHRKDEKNLYDVILQDYEKGMTSEKLDEFFSLLKGEIVPLLKKIKEVGNPEKKLLQKIEIEKQKKFNRFIGEYLGFDFDRGVGAESEHPFTMNITKSDVRLFFVEVMGRDAGFLAQNSAIASGAEAAIIPEDKTDVDQLETFIGRGFRKTKNSSIVIVTESPQNKNGGAMYYADRVKKEYPEYDVRVSILGHLQRGGAPSANDRILASRLGEAAIQALMEDQQNVMIGIRNNEIVYVPFAQAIKNDKPIDKSLIRVLNELSI